MRHNTRKILETLSSKGAFTLIDAEHAGLNRRTILRLHQKGELDRISRGVYQLSDFPDNPSPDYAALQKRVPNGVICLISALYHHNLTTEIPHVIHMAINRNSHIPRLGYPKVRFFRMSPPHFNAGSQTQMIQGVSMRIFSREKTIADCFKYRHLYGIDLAFEALKTYSNQADTNLNGVLKMARVCRVESIVRPYLEFLV